MNVEITESIRQYGIKICIVGGAATHKSGVINKLATSLIKDLHPDKLTLYNGGNPPDNINDHNLVLWLPDIDNNEIKNYPVKDRGAVLICSKVIREGTTNEDAVARIFRMQGNAVLAIHKIECNSLRFQLIDALGNSWCDTQDIAVVTREISNLYLWTRSSIRKSIPHAQYTVTTTDPEGKVEPFIDLNRHLADQVITQCGSRFFGNYSTRCARLFPSTRSNKSKDAFYFSPRNVDKANITYQNMILVMNREYHGDRKPSIDTPVQLELYKAFPEINYIVHGHAFIQYTPFTTAIYPCGDLREVPAIIKVTKRAYCSDHTSPYKINLAGHGFLLMATTLDELKDIVKNCVFYRLSAGE